MITRQPRIRATAAAMHQDDQRRRTTDQTSCRDASMPHGLVITSAAADASLESVGNQVLDSMVCPLAASASFMEQGQSVVTETSPSFNYQCPLPASTWLC